jgi:hypothetical protein
MQSSVRVYFLVFTLSVQEPNIGLFGFSQAGRKLKTAFHG